METKHILDNDEKITKPAMNKDGTGFEMVEITEASERYAFFEGVAKERLRLLKKERNKLLEETDWLIIRNQEQNIEIPSSWKAYRQELRDITKTYKSILDVVWPTPPEEE